MSPLSASTDGPEDGFWDPWDDTRGSHGSQDDDADSTSSNESVPEWTKPAPHGQDRGNPPQWSLAVIGRRGELHPPIDLKKLGWRLGRARIGEQDLTPWAELREIRLSLTSHIVSRVTRPTVLATVIGKDNRRLTYRQRLRVGENALPGARGISLVYRQDAAVPRTWWPDLALLASIVLALAILAVICIVACSQWSTLPWCAYTPRPTATATAAQTPTYTPLSELGVAIRAAATHSMSNETLQTLDMLVEQLDTQWDSGFQISQSTPMTMTGGLAGEGSVNIVPARLGSPGGECRPVLVVVNKGVASFCQRLRETGSHFDSCPGTKLLVFVSDYWNDDYFDRYCSALDADQSSIPEMILLLRALDRFRVLPAGRYACPGKLDVEK